MALTKETARELLEFCAISGTPISVRQRDAWVAAAEVDDDFELVLRGLRVSCQQREDYNRRANQELRAAGFA